MIAVLRLITLPRGIFFFIALWPSWLLASSPLKIDGNSAMANLRGSGFEVAAADKPGAKTEQSTEVRRLIAAAKEKGERELVLTWDEAALGGSSAAKTYEALFKRTYGIDVRVNFTPGPTMPAMAGRITQEVAAGRNSSTDVFLGSGTHCGPLLDRNVFEAYDYTKLSPRISKSMIEPRNMCVEIYSTIGGIIYNTNSIAPAEAPRKLEDVLNPKWKGRIASTPYAAYFDRVAMRPEWGIGKMQDFLKRLSGNIGGLIRVNEVQRIISGEFVMLVLGSDQDVSVEKAKGAPVEFIIADDAAVVGFIYMGVPRTAAHPNLGKLFINTLLSEEGQKILYEASFVDHHELPGSQSTGKLRGLKTRGIEPLRVDLQLTVNRPEMDQAREGFQKALLQKR
jgi:ABC-type Fe3+ transport system substrate-binding protein